MKNPKINRDQPAMAEPAVAQLKPRTDPPPDRHARTVTLSIGGRRYEMTWHWESREITRGPAQVIAMPGPSAGNRRTDPRVASVEVSNLRRNDLLPAPGRSMNVVYPAGPGRKEKPKMRTFILDADHNITVYASQQEAAAAMPAGDAFTTAAGLRAALKNYSAATAVGIWNSVTGVTPVKKFKDAATAAKRIFAEVQKLGGPDAVAAEAPVTTRKTKAATPQAGRPVKAAKGRPSVAKNAAPARAAGPRETSKTAQLIEMLRTRDGATLEAICRKFGWQAHTTRALMSAGGSLTKKHGITVISEKVGDSRSYRIAK
jgi:hypothetical protein